MVRRGWAFFKEESFKVFFFNRFPRPEGSFLFPCSDFPPFSVVSAYVPRNRYPLIISAGTQAV